MRDVYRFTSRVGTVFAIVSGNAPQGRPVSVIRHWGSSVEERGEAYPCDGLLESPDDVLYRAVSVTAPTAVVFRWLCQLRAAPDSYDWIDNYGKSSPRELTPGLEQLAIGQSVAGIFRLASYELNQHLTIVVQNSSARRVFGDVAITYRVKAAASGSRIIVKLLIRHPRGLFRWLAPLLPAGDLVMMRRQLLNFKRHAETALTGRSGAS